MNHSAGWAKVSLLLFAIVLAESLLPARAAEGDKLAKKLEERITLEKGLDPNTKIKDALEFFGDRYDIKIVVDREAFKTAGTNYTDDPEIYLPRLKAVRLATVLRLSLKQVDAIYVLENGIVKVVPKPKEKKKAIPTETKETDEEKKVREKLKTEITLEKGIEPSSKLGDALAFISDRVDVNIFVDRQAFADEKAINGLDDQEVRFPPIKDISLDFVLKQMLLQVRGTYVIRENVIEVIPAKDDKK